MSKDLKIRYIGPVVYKCEKPGKSNGRLTKTKKAPAPKGK